MDGRKTVKKTLVRNPELPIPREVQVLPSRASISSRFVNMDCDNCDFSQSETATFNVPEIYSTQKLSKKIDEIVKPRKTKSLEVDGNKLAIGEQVSRRVNIPYGQKVFKDLISITNKEMKTPQPAMAIKSSSYHKDPEPNLDDFLKEESPKIHYHKPKSCLGFKEDRSNLNRPNALRLYKLLQIHENQTTNNQ